MRSPAPPVPPRARLTSGTTAAVRFFLFLTGGLSAVAAYTNLDYANKIGDFIRRESSFAANAVIDAEDLAGTFSGLTVLSGVVAFILLMVWGNKAYNDVLGRGVTGGRWGPGWAVGGWFIPFANLVIPKLVLNEVDRMSQTDSGATPTGDSWRGRAVIPAGTGWWVISIAAVVLVGIGGSMREDAATVGLFGFDLDGYRQGTQFIAAGLATSALAQFFGAAYFKVLGARFQGQ